MTSKQLRARAYGYAVLNNLIGENLDKFPGEEPMEVALLTAYNMREEHRKMLTMAERIEKDERSLQALAESGRFEIVSLEGEGS